HLADHAGLVDGLLQPSDQLVALRLGGVEGDQVVVVEGEAPGAELLELAHGLEGVEVGPGSGAELVAGGPAHGPQAEGELVRRGRGERGGEGGRGGDGGHRESFPSWLVTVTYYRS